jgi:hypothetical protein
MDHWRSPWDKKEEGFVMNKLAFELGQRFALAQALGNSSMTKVAGSRAAEMLLGMLPGGPFLAGIPSGASDDPKAKYWPAVGRSFVTNIGAGLGGSLGAGLGGLLTHSPQGVGIGGLLGLGGGLWGGRALGEALTDYDPEKGY